MLTTPDMGWCQLGELTTASCDERPEPVQV